MKLSYQQLGKAFRKAYWAERRINRTQDVDWQLKAFGQYYNCQVHATPDAGGDMCIDYLEFATPEEATMFMLRWS
jgi:hypothetical protein